MYEWSHKVFNGKRYRAEMLFRLKGEANKKAKFARKHGALVRVIKEKGGYRLWVHGSV